jgi:hypothetical protein
MQRHIQKRRSARIFYNDGNDTVSSQRGLQAGNYRVCPAISPVLERPGNRLRTSTVLAPETMSSEIGGLVPKWSWTTRGCR